jgi:hypothetical protein
MQLSKQLFQSRIYKTLLLPIVGSIIQIFALGDASAKDVIAPYDAIVCFDSDFSSCVGKSVGNLFQLYQDMFEEIDGKLSLRSQNVTFPGPKVEISNSYYEQEPPNKPITYQCHYENGLSAPILGLKDKKAIIYISVPIFVSLHDDLYRLKQAQSGCHDLILSFNFEITQLAARQNLALFDGVAEYLSNILQAEVYAKGGVGATALSAEQQQKWSMTGAQTVPTEVDALLKMRQASPPKREQIKNVADDNKMLYLATKFGDAIREIDFYEREIELNIYLINLGVTNMDGHNLKTNVLNGSWVTKGSIVGTVD